MWKRSAEKGRQPRLNRRLSLAPLLVTNEESGHDEDRLLWAVEVGTSVSGLVDVQKVHGPAARIGARERPASDARTISRLRAALGPLLTGSDTKGDRAGASGWVRWCEASRSPPS